MAGNTRPCTFPAFFEATRSWLRHGNKDMPVWGPLFRNLSQGHDSEVQQRIANLNQYVESIQKK